MQYISFSIGTILFLFFVLVAFISIKEKQKRATIVSLISSIILSAPFVFLAIINVEIYILILVSVTSFFLLVLFIPTGKKKMSDMGKPNSLIDERDIVFSRMLLKKGSERFENYYKDNPSNLKPDEDFRSKPGLLAEGSTEYNNVIFKTAQICFNFIKLLYDDIDGKTSEHKEKVDTEKITYYIKNWSKKLGAINVGITELKKHHLYSYRGREKNYGNEVKNKHKYAIVFTVEMDRDMMSAAPGAPTVLESSEQYINAAVIAVTISSFIRNLGYSAKAHIDGNYEVLCTPIAEDAGLGVIGRLGLLITPYLGPRVRLSVVTTDLPIISDKKTTNSSIIDFCNDCKKCADVCPTAAIPFDEQKNHNGVKKWKVNMDACFKYWCISGTDCGKCMSVCPFSHPNNMFHNVIRWGINNSVIFRRFALLMDNLFYGKKPTPAQAPDWMNLKN